MPLIYFCLMVVSAFVMSVVKQELNIHGENPLFSLINFTIVGFFLAKLALSLKTILNEKSPVIGGFLSFVVVTYCVGVGLSVLDWIMGGTLF